MSSRPVLLQSSRASSEFKGVELGVHGTVSAVLQQLNMCGHLAALI